MHYGVKKMQNMGKIVDFSCISNSVAAFCAPNDCAKFLSKSVYNFLSMQAHSCVVEL